MGAFGCGGANNVYDKIIFEFKKSKFGNYSSYETGIKYTPWVLLGCCFVEFLLILCQLLL